MTYRILKSEFQYWTLSEILWLIFCVALTGGLAAYLRDTPLGITAAVTGVMYTVLAGKGKLSCYLFGIVNTITYSLISYNAKLYGEVMLNMLWYLPMMFVGLWCWRKHLDEHRIICKAKLTHKERLIWAVIAATGVARYAYLLKHWGDQLPILDSTTTVLSVIAMVFTVKRCIEQWLLWTIVNICSIYMWYLAYANGSGSLAVLFMWILALANGMIFYLKWRKEVK